MNLLRAIHLLGLIAWFGTAAADVVLELSLGRTGTRDGRRALVRLHRRVDLIVEGPAAVVVIVTGVMLLNETGRLAGPWPGWLVWKVGCGVLAAATNLVCAAFVVARASAFDAVPASEDPWASPSVRRWHRAILATGFGIPFAIGAFWLGFSHGS